MLSLPLLSSLLKLPNDVITKITTLITHLVKRSTNINRAVLDDIVYNLRQRGGEIWIRELNRKEYSVMKKESPPALN